MKCVIKVNWCLALQQSLIRRRRSHLAPLDAEATQETARLQYSTMDINFRVKVLQIMCMLFLETKTVKTFLEESSMEMTRIRKIKIEHQKARKIW